MLPSKINENIADKLLELDIVLDKKLQSNESKAFWFKMTSIGLILLSSVYQDEVSLAYGEQASKIMIALSIVTGITAFTVNSVKSKAQSYNALEESILFKRRFENKIIKELKLSREEYMGIPELTRVKLINESIGVDFIEKTFENVGQEVRDFLSEEKKNKKLEYLISKAFKMFQSGVINAGVSLNKKAAKRLIERTASKIDNFKM